MIVASAVAEGLSAALLAGGGVPSVGAAVGLLAAGAAVAAWPELPHPIYRTMALVVWAIEVMTALNFPSTQPSACAYNLLAILIGAALGIAAVALPSPLRPATARVEAGARLRLAAEAAAQRAAALTLAFITVADGGGGGGGDDDAVRLFAVCVSSCAASALALAAALALPGKPLTVRTPLELPVALEVRTSLDVAIALVEPRPPVGGRGGGGVRCRSLPFDPAPT
jgi:hypothetical protein